MCAKYGRSRMNDVHTISPTDLVGHPAKVVRSTTFFLKKKAFFVRLLHQPLASQLVGLGLSTWIIAFIQHLLIKCGVFNTTSLQQRLIALRNNI